MKNKAMRTTLSLLLALATMIAILLLAVACNNLDDQQPDKTPQDPEGSGNDFITSILTEDTLEACIGWAIGNAKDGEKVSLEYGEGQTYGEANDLAYFTLTSSEELYCWGLFADDQSAQEMYEYELGYAEDLPKNAFAYHKIGDKVLEYGTANLQDTISEATIPAGSLSEKQMNIIKSQFKNLKKPSGNIDYIDIIFTATKHDGELCLTFYSEESSFGQEYYHLIGFNTLCEDDAKICGSDVPAIAEEIGYNYTNSSYADIEGGFVYFDLQNSKGWHTVANDSSAAESYNIVGLYQADISEYNNMYVPAKVGDRTIDSISVLCTDDHYLDIKTLTLAEGIKDIAHIDLYSNITTLNLPSTLRSIPNLSALSSPSLAHISYNGTQDMWYALLKEHYVSLTTFVFDYLDDITVQCTDGTFDTAKYRAQAAAEQGQPGGQDIFRAEFEEELAAIIEEGYNTGKPSYLQIKNVHILRINRSIQSKIIYYETEINNKMKIGTVTINNDALEFDTYKEILAHLTDVTYAYVKSRITEQGVPEDICAYALAQQQVQDFLLANGVDSSAIANFEVINTTEFNSANAGICSNITMLVGNKIFTLTIGGHLGACDSQREYLTKLQNGRLGVIDEMQLTDYEELAL